MPSISAQMRRICRAVMPSARKAKSFTTLAVTSENSPTPMMGGWSSPSLTRPWMRMVPPWLSMEIATWPSSMMRMSAEDPFPQGALARRHVLRVPLGAGDGLGHVRAGEERREQVAVARVHPRREVAWRGPDLAGLVAHGFLGVNGGYDGHGRVP